MLWRVFAQILLENALYTKIECAGLNMPFSHLINTHMPINPFILKYSSYMFFENELIECHINNDQRTSCFSPTNYLIISC